MQVYKCDVCKKVKEGTMFNVRVMIHNEDLRFQAGPHCEPYKYIARDVCFSCMEELNKLLFLLPVYDSEGERVNE